MQLKTDLLPEQFGLDPLDWSDLYSAFENCKEIDSVYLFGSRAIGNFDKGSDIDLAIQGDTITTETISTLSTQLNEDSNLPYFIDLVDYSKIENEELKAHIDRVGLRIY